VSAASRKSSPWRSSGHAMMPTRMGPGNRSIGILRASSARSTPLKAAWVTSSNAIRETSSVAKTASDRSKSSIDRSVRRFPPSQRDPVRNSPHRSSPHRNSPHRNSPHRNSPQPSHVRRASFITAQPRTTGPICGILPDLSRFWQAGCFQSRKVELDDRRHNRALTGDKQGYSDRALQLRP
jgi:hypothetical protein